MKRGLTILLTLTLLFNILPLHSGAVSETDRYTDWDQVGEKAAVAMLTDLKLVSGYDDGSFRPERPVTRAEAAKMMAGLLEEEVPEGDTCRYPDAAGIWAAGYIELCAGQGIISGPAGSDFRPGDAVTVRELAKMLLAVLGHDTEVYTGLNWAAAVDADAAETGLYNGDWADKGRAARREETCLLVNNALQSGVVQGYTETGDPVYELDGMLEPKTLLELRFHTTPVTGVVQATATGDLRTEGDRPGKNCIRLSGYVREFEVSAETARDKTLLGHRVIVYAHLGSDVNKVLGIPAISPAEICHEVVGREVLNAVMDVEGLSTDEDTAYYLNYTPSDALCLENLDDDEQVTVIDHDGDRVVDMVLVFRETNVEEDE